MGDILTGRVVIVTGGGAGIGRATALACAGAGANVAVADKSAGALNETVKLIRERGRGSAHGFEVDVSDPDSVKDMVCSIENQFGRLDGAFNNAGISQRNAPLHEISIDQWRQVQSVNFDGVFYCMKYQIPVMLRSGGGSIVNTSSALGRVAIKGASEYCGSKGGVLGLTRGAALDYANQNIRVNALLPGVIETPLVGELTGRVDGLLDTLKAAHPMGRLGRPEEVAESVVWLLSMHSSFVTGTELSVDGGYLAI